MTWLTDLFGIPKPIIGMAHFRPLPGDPRFRQPAENAETPPDLLNHVIRAGEALRRDIEALQEGGVDGIMLSNEGSLPWMTNPPPVTTASMAAQIGIARSAIRIPFGVHVIWNPMATLDLAAAVEADYGWEVFTGVYASDFGLWNTNVGETARHRRRIGASGVRLLFEVVPEAAVYLGSRTIVEQVHSTFFNALPDALCVAGLKPGEPASLDVVREIKAVNQDVPVLVSTGVKESTVSEQLAAADGAIVGSALKKDGNLWNHVDAERVKSFMRVAKSARA